MQQSPPPPSQQQADEAQSARYAAEAAALTLFESTQEGAGGGENESSVLQTIRLAAILTALSTAIVYVSFRDSRDRSKSLLLSRPDHEQISEAVLAESQREFNSLAASDLDDKQKAVLWATWAYSRTADEIAAAINRGDLPHEFAERGANLKKIWISRSDRRVRPLHAKLHGRAIGVDTDFWRWPDTGQRLRWPGDKEAPSDAVFGCRCVCLLSWASQDDVSDTIKRIVEYTDPE